MSREQDNKSGRPTPAPAPGTPGSADDGKDAKIPRPSRPFIPGPVISEPDEVVKIWTPLPPVKEK